MDYLTLTEAARTLPNNPHPASVWRWCRKGVASRCGRRVKLNHIRLGGKLYVTDEDLQRFGQELAEADAEHFDEADSPTPNRDQAKPRTDAQRQRDIEQAEDDCKSVGA